MAGASGGEGGFSCPYLLAPAADLVDEVAELTVRDLGDDRAARAAQQAATGRHREIARLGRSVGVHLVCCVRRPDAVAVPGQLSANLEGAFALRSEPP